MPPIKRPHWSRWFLATLVAWCACPLFAPLLWRMMLVEGAGLATFAAALLWTYFMGLPFAGIGMLALLLVSAVAYRLALSLPWWAWAVWGGGVGFVILFFMAVSPVPTDFDVDAPAVWFLSSAVVPGMMGAIIFRKILMHGHKTNYKLG